MINLRRIVCAILSEIKDIYLYKYICIYIYIYILIQEICIVIQMIQSQRKGKKTNYVFAVHIADHISMHTFTVIPLPQSKLKHITILQFTEQYCSLQNSFKRGYIFFIFIRLFITCTNLIGCRRTTLALVCIQWHKSNSKSFEDLKVTVRLIRQNGAYHTILFTFVIQSNQVLIFLPRRFCFHKQSSVQTGRNF